MTRELTLMYFTKQPIRRNRLKTAKSGPTSENVQRHAAYSRVGARWSGYGEKPWRGSQNDGSGKKRLSRADVGKRLTTRWSIVGWARGGRDTVKNHGAAAKTTVRAKNG